MKLDFFGPVGICFRFYTNFGAKIPWGKSAKIVQHFASVFLWQKSSNFVLNSINLELLKSRNQTLEQTSSHREQIFQLVRTFVFLGSIIGVEDGIVAFQQIFNQHFIVPRSRKVVLQVLLGVEVWNEINLWKTDFKVHFVRENLPKLEKRSKIGKKQNKRRETKGAENLAVFLQVSHKKPNCKQFISLLNSDAQM